MGVAPIADRFLGLHGSIANYSAAHNDYLVQFDDCPWNMVWLPPSVMRHLSLLEILAEESR